MRERYASFRGLLNEADVNYREIEERVSPQSDRKEAIPVGWVKTPEGYFIQLTSKGYKETHVKIYAPESVKIGTHFKPSAHLAIPTKGQMIALSKVVIDKYLKSYADKGAYYLTGVRLNDAEKELVAKYPMDAAHIAYLTAVAGYITRKNFPEDEHIDNKADAFRHYYWAGMVGKQLGDEKGRKFLDAHESDPDNPDKEKRMDLYNNNEGLKFSKNYKGKDFEEDLEKSGLDKIKNRELKWLK
ncbi:DUF6973 domain-containing protein [uncultured Bdellovibrio sp.]|uniref:DUF6973 domain-containing protein n=1 Tax=Bdellovibrio sp. HCB-162 TaxID=3394234 RepID=UPI0025E70AF0|nr:hypothetical protein [uncultured Bdellovibrio sp.]